MDDMVKIKKININVKKIKDKGYPDLLKELKGEAPKQLYYKGSWDDSIFENCLAVVGSRRMTSYGKQITEKIVGQIAASGITIVSGFMYGIDATAHQAALDVGGRTIAVMPCGMDYICPEYQGVLYRKIIENNGLIISEFEADQKAAYWTFPKRNRIVAGLSQATLIVEAAEKSGSLITANIAKKYQRKVFAIPGPLTSILSAGTSNLIKNGAEMVTGADDIIKYYGVGNGVLNRATNIKDVRRSVTNTSLEEQIVYELQAEPLEIDVLSRKIDVPISKIGTAISMMQLKGLIKEEKGKYYVY